MATNTLKLSDEALKELGLQASELTEERILAIVRENKKVKADASAFEVQIKDITEKFTALEGRMVTLEARKIEAVVSDADRKAIIESARTEAKTVASSEVASIIAKTGTNALKGGAGGGTNDDAKPGFAERVKEKRSANKEMKDPAIITACIKEFPAEYAEWRKNPTPLN